MRKPTIWVPTRSDTNRAVQSQKQARSLKIWVKIEEELFYPCNENKGADQLRSYSPVQIVYFPMRRLKLFYFLIILMI